MTPWTNDNVLSHDEQHEGGTHDDGTHGGVTHEGGFKGDGDHGQAHDGDEGHAHEPPAQESATHGHREVIHTDTEDSLHAKSNKKGGQPAEHEGDIHHQA